VIRSNRGTRCPRYAARKCLNVVENVERVLAIELMAACQGLDFLRPLKSTPAIERVHSLVRTKVPFWDEDMHAAPLMAAVVDLIRSGKVMAAVDQSLLPAVRAARVTLERPLSTTSFSDLGTMCVVASPVRVLLRSVVASSFLVALVVLSCLVLPALVFSLASLQCGQAQQASRWYPVAPAAIRRPRHLR